MTTTELIKFEHVSFSVGVKQILNRVSFSVYEGEFLSLIGPNGAGKTTVLKCLMRILNHTDGSILLNNNPLSNFSQKELAKWISYVPQSHTCADIPFSVEEFVSLARYPYLNPLMQKSREDQEIVEWALEMTNLTSFSQRNVSSLSGGEHQKVLIATALAQKTKVLLLDEPLTYLDYKHQYEIQKLLRYINQELGLIIILVTHDINNAIRSSNRLLALKHGEVIFCDGVQELLDRNIPESLYEVPFQLLPQENSKVPLIVQEAAE